jgi:hypothetical protein
MIKRIIFCVILFSVMTAAIFAKGENLAIKIAIMGPGDEVYFWWGHIALVIEDSNTNRITFYDYGLFSFDNENFYTNFAFGRLLYCCGGSPAETSIANYKKHDRGIVIYTLNLLPEKRTEIKDFVENNILPENRDYYYHHFKDNCCTRIRDIIDLATDGQFKEKYGQAPGRFTFREHVYRHTWFSPAIDWGLSFWMGQVIDTQITEWEEMFLPSEVGKRIEDFYFTGTDGVRRKLVTGKETVYTAENRPVVLDSPVKQWPRNLAFSLALSAVFGFFFFLRAKKIRAGVILAGFSMSLSGLFFGLMGSALYFLNLFTNHDYTYNNINMLIATPHLLAAFPLGISYALTESSDRRLTCEIRLRFIWIITVLGIIISMAIKILPQFRQQNLSDQLLILPIAVVFAFQPAGLREAAGKFLKKKKS